MFLTPSPLVDAALLGILLLVGGHTLFLIFRKRWLFCDPLNIFWAGGLMCYVAQPVAYYDTFVAWHDEAIIAETSIWVIAGFLFVIIGYSLPIGLRIAQRLPRLPASLDSRRLTVAAVILILLGILGYVYLISSAGGAQAWFAESRGATDVESISGYLAQLEGLLPIGVLILLFDASTSSTSRVRVTIVALVTGAFLFFLIYLGTRSRVIYLVVTILAAYYLPRRRNPQPALLLVIGAILIVTSQFLGMYRQNFTNLSFNLDNIDFQEARASVLPAAFGGDKLSQSDRLGPGIEFNVVLSVIELVPNQVPYNFGYGHLELLTRPIPRNLWPDKRYPHMESVQGVLRTGNLSGATVKTSNQNLLAGPSFTFVGHWYYVAGPLGMLIGGIMTGVLLRTIRGIYDRDPGNIGDWMVFTSLLFIGLGEAAATPLLFFTSLPFQLIPLVIALRLSAARECASLETVPMRQRPSGSRVFSEARLR
jgi:hypothetical protein